MPLNYTEKYLFMIYAAARSESAVFVLPQWHSKMVIILFWNYLALVHAVYFHPAGVDTGFQDASHVTVSLVKQFDTPEGFADNVCHMKISKNRREACSWVLNTCRWHIFRASLTLDWLVVSADAGWQLRWSQAFFGWSLFREQSLPFCWPTAKRTKVTASHRACLDFCVLCQSGDFARYITAEWKCANCKLSTCQLCIWAFSMWCKNALDWLIDCVKTRTDAKADVTYLSRCCLMYGIPSHIRKNRLAKIYN